METWGVINCLKSLSPVTMECGPRVARFMIPLCRPDGAQPCGFADDGIARVRTPYIDQCLRSGH